MKARILLLVAFFILPNFLLAQNWYTHLNQPISLNQKRMKSHFDNNSEVGLNSSFNLLNFQSDTLRSDCDSSARSLYVIRLAGIDKEDCINFYGLSLGWFHQNPNANFSGLAFNGVVGDSVPFFQANPDDNNISINGINISLLSAGTTGTINGISLGSLLGNQAREVNGVAMGLFGAYSDYLNGLAIGGLFTGGKNTNAIQVGGLGCGSENANGILIGGIMSVSKNANAIQIGSIINGYCIFNGIGIATYNRIEEFDSLQVTNINGLILGIYNDVSVRGLSIGIVNNGNSWLQIGLLNMGDSAVQIGLVNLDGDGKMGIPIININF